jgi:hypothetical protein
LQTPIRVHHLGWLLGTLLAWGFWCGGAAHAQDRDARASATARALFHEGVTCADARDWTCAADRFGRARAVRPSPVILDNHGIALDHLGRLVEASEAYRGVLRDPSASDELRTHATRAIALIAPRIGSVTVMATGPIDGVSFSMDGQAFDTSLLGVAVPSDPGAHRLEARRAETVVASRSVELAVGGNARLDLAIPAPEPGQAVSIEAAMNATIGSDVTTRGPEGVLGSDTDVASASHHEVYEEWWFWTVIGIVVVGAGAGVTAAVVTSNETTLPMGSVGTIDVRP